MQNWENKIEFLIRPYILGGRVYNQYRTLDSNKLEKDKRGIFIISPFSSLTPFLDILHLSLLFWCNQKYKHKIAL